MESGEYVADRPPLVAGKIHGVRSWKLLDGGAAGAVLLGSMSSGSYWPPGGPLTARCIASAESPHAAPQRGCGCGIYAWHPSNAVDSMALESGPLWGDGSLLCMVTGVVEAWGRIEVHEAGFRAEHARPTTLFAEAGAPKERRQMIKRLAKSYGADVIEVVDDRELAAQIESLPHGVDPAWLEELLASGVELTLKSAANGFLSGREQIALGGAGYLLKGHDPPDRWRPQQEVPERGVWVARVAGTAFRPHALQDRSFDPGRAVRLIPEPHNPHDPNAIGIWDEGLTLQAGFIPAELASIVGRMLGEGRLAVAMSLWQWRDLESGQRIGLHVLLSCTDRIDSVPGTDLEFLAHMERERGDDPGPESDWSGAALERPDDAIEW